ncbi:MAG: phosphatase PAP2 family protein, partial [Desulfovibrionales bacterium]
MDKQLKTIGLTGFLLLTIFAAGVFIAAGWAGTGLESALRALDSRLVRAFAGTSEAGLARGPEWLATSVRDITSLGGLTLTSATALMASVFFLSLRRFRAAATLLCSSSGGIAISFALKDFFARPRPDQALHMVTTQTFGFPSGHAMVSAAVYLTLAGILSQNLQNRLPRLLTFLTAGLVIVSTGVSRIYLGV